MEWLNLHSSILDSPELVGAEPVDRATWLFLLRYCIGQENGGTIADCADWGDRRWQQLVRVTLAEVQRSSALWRFVGGSLQVNFYPTARQKEIEAKRQAGKDTVAKRWGKQECSADSSATSSATRSADTEGEGEGERKDKGKSKIKTVGATRAAVAAPVTDANWIAELKADPAYAGIDVERELAKMQSWCRVKRRNPTRLRFVNWLNRIDAPIAEQQSSLLATAADSVRTPGWGREFRPEQAAAASALELEAK